MVYELGTRSFLEDTERTKSLQCGPPVIGMSLQSGNKMQETKALEVAELDRGKEFKAHYAMQDLIRSHCSARFDVMWEAGKRLLLDKRTQTADLLEHEHEEMTAI